VEEASRLRLKTTYGDISVTRSSGHAEVTTTHGAIRIGEIDGTAVVKNSHGDVSLGEVAGGLRLNNAHGDSTIDRPLAGVTAKTAYGSVRIREVASGTVVMETTGGSLELGIREGTAAWLDVSSKDGTMDIALDPGDAPGQATRSSRCGRTPPTATSPSTVPDDQEDFMPDAIVAESLAKKYGNVTHSTEWS
jgi:hypothetical protein